MKKNVWILNHYATDMYTDGAGRHHWFALELKKHGYDPLIVCASTIHSSDKTIDLEGKQSLQNIKDGIPYLFIKTSNYSGNGVSRVRNIVEYALNTYRVLKKYTIKPDVIIASSVHPLTCIAGIKLAKIFKVPCIVEIRDLWPQELIDMKVMNKNSAVAKALYCLEYWIYKNADAIVFTMEGGKQYVVDRGWAGKEKVDLKKIYYINNGVSLNEYNANLKQHILQDQDLENNIFFKIVYTGSIRQANGIDRILEMAAKITEPNIKFLIWGAGNYVETMLEQIKEKKLTNVIYKGFVKKEYVPYILSKSDLNILNYQNAYLFKYGCSNNKLFEYLASGKPILSTIKMNYSILNQFRCGIEVDSVEESVSEILKIYHMKDSERDKLVENTIKAANNFDFVNLTTQLVKVIESC